MKEKTIDFPEALRQIRNGFMEQSVAAMLGAVDDEQEETEEQPKN